MTIDTINGGKLIGAAAGKAVAAELADALPPVFAGIADTLARTLAQLAQPHMCATCVARHVSWQRANRAALEEAAAVACEAAGVSKGSPEAAKLDLAPFLPGRVTAAGIPAVAQAVTTEQGTDKCAEHVSGVQGAGTPLVAATVGVPPGALAQPARLLPG